MTDNRVVGWRQRAWSGGGGNEGESNGAIGEWKSGRPCEPDTPVRHSAWKAALASELGACVMRCPAASAPGRDRGTELGSVSWCRCRTWGKDVTVRQSQGSRWVWAAG